MRRIDKSSILNPVPPAYDLLGGLVLDLVAVVSFADVARGGEPFPWIDAGDPRLGPDGFEEGFVGGLLRFRVRGGVARDLPLAPRRALRAAVAELGEEDAPMPLHRELREALDDRLPGLDEGSAVGRRRVDEREVAAHTDPIQRIPERDVEHFVEIRAVREGPR